MFLNYYLYILFFPLIAISSLMIFLSNSWFSMWMIMEINLISYICILIFDKNIKNDIPMMYFLFQSFNSYMFLMSSIFMNFNTNLYNLFSQIIMNLSMLMKLSIFPFHFWYMKMLFFMNWMNLFLFSTIQKIIPLYILNILFSQAKSNIMFSMNLILLVISSFMSSVLSINQISLKLIMSFSSMIQMSWIIIMLMFNEKMSMIYFIIYSIISMNLFFMFYSLNLNYLNNSLSTKFKNMNMMYSFMVSILSLASAPPFFGFFMKWISLNYIFNKLNFFIIIIMIMNSLISMFFYFRVMFLSIMFFKNSKKINFKFFNKNYFIFNYKMMTLNFFMFSMIMIYEII